MVADDTPLGLTAPDRVHHVRDVLERQGYTEAGICEWLGGSEMLPPSQRRQSLPLLLYRTRNDSPRETLIRLFHLGQPVALEAARRSLSPVSLEDWGRLGLVRQRRDEILPCVELIPYDSCVFASDWPHHAMNRGDPVMGIAASTRTLAQLTLWSRGERTLDLGTGCGVLALLAARHGHEVTGVDCNRRAIQFAQFNAQLNRLPDIRWQAGDFFEPVREQAFDLIVCNPPFVIGPRTGAIHSHGGWRTDAICETLTRTAPDFLRDGGTFQMVLNWAQVTGEDWRDRLAEWCRDGGCDALLLYSHVQPAAEYAQQRIKESVADPAAHAAEFDRWVSYADERIEAIGFGLLTLRRRTIGQPWFDCQPFLPGERPTSEAVASRFMRRDFLRSYGTQERLLTAKLRRPRDLVWLQRHKPSGDAWSLSESYVEVGAGQPPLAIDPPVVEFVAWCRGDRPIRDYLQQLASASGQRPGNLVPEFLKIVRRLVELGILEPATSAEPE